MYFNDTINQLETGVNLIFYASESYLIVRSNSEYEKKTTTIKSS